MKTIDIVARLRSLARTARAQRDHCPLGRELDRLADEVMGVAAGGQPQGQATSVQINGRSVLVQRPRGHFAV